MIAMDSVYDSVRISEGTEDEIDFSYEDVMRFESKVDSRIVLYKTVNEVFQLMNNIGAFKHLVQNATCNVRTADYFSCPIGYMDVRGESHFDCCSKCSEVIDTGGSEPVLHCPHDTHENDDMLHKTELAIEGLMLNNDIDTLLYYFNVEYAIDSNRIIEEAEF